MLRSDWVLVVMDQCTRRLVGVGVHRCPVTGADLCRMFNAAMHGQGTPRHLSTDHDPLFEAHRWTANLRILEIDAIKTVPHVPRSHPFVERLIGTTRRECLDHVLFWNARDLERTLADFQAYYNEVRSHASLRGHTPLTFAGGHTVARAELNNVRWVSHCRDLVQLPVAAWRDRTITLVKQLGRRRWKKVSGYHRQGQVENAFFRYKSIIGDGLRARSPARQGSEAVLGSEILNRMTALGRPVSYRIGR